MLHIFKRVVNLKYESERNYLSERKPNVATCCKFRREFINIFIDWDSVNYCHEFNY